MYILLKYTYYYDVAYQFNKHSICPNTIRTRDVDKINITVNIWNIESNSKNNNL